jgi:pimeloyl-ACP methyl ester carboxylesterase
MQRWGTDGPQVLLVHGGGMGGEMTWREQRPLAERWSLIVIHRRGYFPNPPIDREDFEVDADDVADLLGDGAHLVGHSHGGTASLLAAAKRPEAVRSLTLIEPPAFALAAGDPEVRLFLERIRVCRERSGGDAEVFLRGFLEVLGSSAQIPHPLPAALAQNAELLLKIRNPGEAVIPYEELRRSPFPKLVVSGAHSAVFTRICDELAVRLDAERAIMPGAGHNVQRTGAPFNRRLEAFLDAAEAERGTR